MKLNNSKFALRLTTYILQCKEQVSEARVSQIGLPNDPEWPDLFSSEVGGIEILDAPEHCAEPESEELRGLSSPKHIVLMFRGFVRGPDVNGKLNDG